MPNQTQEQIDTVIGTGQGQLTLEGKTRDIDTWKQMAYSAGYDFGRNVPTDQNCSWPYIELPWLFNDWLDGVHEAYRLNKIDKAQGIINRG